MLLVKKPNIMCILFYFSLGILIKYRCPSLLAEATSLKITIQQRLEYHVKAHSFCNVWSLLKFLRMPRVQVMRVAIKSSLIMCFHMPVYYFVGEKGLVIL